MPLLVLGRGVAHGYMVQVVQVREGNFLSAQARAVAGALLARSTGLQNLGFFPLVTLPRESQALPHLAFRVFSFLWDAKLYGS